MSNETTTLPTSTQITIVEKPKLGRPLGSKNRPKKRKRRAKVNKEANAIQTQSKTPVKRSVRHVKSWQRYLLSVNDEIAENKPVLMIGERLLVSAGGIVTTTGKPKSYKTFLASAILGAFLKGEYMNIFSNCTDSQAKALLVDTEQGRARTQIVQRRIHAICDNNLELVGDRLITLSVREISPKDRTKVLFDALYGIKPKLVVIDGIRDLIKDFNNCHSAEKIIHQLLTDKGLRFNDSREFFSISSTDAINVVLSISDSLNLPNDVASNEICSENENEDIAYMYYDKAMDFYTGTNCFEDSDKAIEYAKKVLNWVTVSHINC